MPWRRRPDWRDWARAYADWDDRVCARLARSTSLTAVGLSLLWLALVVVAVTAASIRSWHIGPPLAVAALLAVALTPLFRRRMREQLRERRRRDGQCLHCGYDLRASADRCPECGEVPDP